MSIELNKIVFPANGGCCHCYQPYVQEVVRRFGTRETSISIELNALKYDPARPTCLCPNPAMVYMDALWTPDGPVVIRTRLPI